ncbi:M20/M25/M40 family metallo-hydrolase [Enterococcus faecalis]|uniref:M20/M25/M40 family metallo-hydrolase n=1 Tax=Enterococcus faecalis TaxID=1351 RepID=UPI0018657F14|nr:M20/M25/M40 family metallo-hydrolase [Enterococcus faecalis]
MKDLEKLKILKDMVSIDTQDKNESEIADYISTLFSKYDIQIEKVNVSDNRDNLLAYLGKGKKVLGVTGHMDVVSVGELDLWSHDPFDMVEKDGKLYGRGTSDMKSGLAALVIAMIELKEENVKLNGQVKLLATVDEEKNETGAKKLVEEGFADDLDALIVAEPSGVSKEALLQQKDNFEFSSSDLEKLLNNNKTNEQHFLIYAHNGSYDYKVTSIGKTAHSSMPHLGVNAIDNLMLYYNKQQEYFATSSKEKEDEVLGKIVPVNTIISGGEQINSVPSEAYLVGRIRTTPTQTGEMITKDLNKIIADLNTKEDVQLSLEVLNNQSPVKSDTNSEFIKLVKLLGSEYLEQEYPLMHVAGGTDAATFIKANPSLQVAVVGPGNNTSHMVDEFVDKDIFLKSIDFYKAVMKEYLN